MRTYSLCASSEGLAAIWTQVSATDAREALRVFLEGSTLTEYHKHIAGWPPPFRDEDVVLFTPMEPFKGMTLAQIGREGKYVTVHLVRTEVA
jgi:hypothetical protein